MAHPLTAPAVQEHRPDCVDLRMMETAHRRITCMLSGMIGLVVMLALKRHYSTASADQLQWILAPTARLVTWFTSAHPVFEAGVGYVDFASGIIIAPACAGINFMIMAFGLAAGCGVIRIRRLAVQLAWLAMAATGAYTMALAVNSVRIAVSMTLYGAAIYGDWITAARIHRLAGIGIYFGGLWLFYRLAAPIINGFCRSVDPRPSDSRRLLPNWLPYGWYLTIAAGVPVANMVCEDRSPDLREHIATIIAALVCFRLAAVAVNRITGAFMRQHQRGGNRHSCKRPS